MLDSRVVGFADVVPPNCCHPFLLEALLFLWPKKGVVLLGQCLEHKTPKSNKSVPAKGYGTRPDVRKTPREERQAGGLCLPAVPCKARAYAGGLAPRSCSNCPSSLRIFSVSFKLSCKRSHKSRSYFNSMIKFFVLDVLLRQVVAVSNDPAPDSAFAPPFFGRPSGQLP